MDTLHRPRHRDSQQSRLNHPGYFGKLPQRGDFIRTGLNPDFVNVWDHWLSNGLDNSKKVLGKEWLQCYLHAPVWHFYLASGVIDDSAHIGIWFPSMDKVGRYFPFTFCCPIHEPPDNWLHDARVEEFIARLERIGLVALDEACELEDVDEALEDIHWPLQHLPAFKRTNSRLNAKTTPQDSTIGLNNLLFDTVRNDHPLLTFWWSQSGDGKTKYRIHDGLPDNTSFVDFFDC